MVDDGDLVVHDILVGLVEIHPLLDDALLVEMQRQSAGVVGAGAAKGAGLDLEHVVMAAAGFIDPFADRVAHIGRIDLLGPIAPIGENPPLDVAAIDQDIGGVRQDDDLHRLEQGHDQRHAAGAAGVAARGAGAAGRLVRFIGLENGGVFRGERSLLGLAPALGRVIGRLRRARRARKRGPVPFTVEVGILRIIEGKRAGVGQAQRRNQRDGADQASFEHDVLPDVRAPGCHCLAVVLTDPDGRKSITAPPRAPRRAELCNPQRRRLGYRGSGASIPTLTPRDPIPAETLGRSRRGNVDMMRCKSRPRHFSRTRCSA